jgi:predicted transcriptional regulator
LTFEGFFVTFYIGGGDIMENDRLEIRLEPELFNRLEAYCKQNKISKSKLIERLCRTILNNTDTSEAEKNLYLIWVENSLKDIVEKIARQNAEIEKLRTEVRDAIKELKNKSVK